MKTKAIAGMNPAPKQPDETTYSGRVAMRLRELRKQREITVPEMLSRLSELGVTVSTPAYYNWEAGGSKLHLDAIPAICKVLKVTAHDIFPKK